MRPELIRASELLRTNTPEAVEQAVDLLQNTVYSFSMKICGHREDAEDTMQDVLFQSLRHLNRFPDPRALAAWLYTVTKNRCRRIRRPRAHAPAKTLSLEELMPDEAELRRLLQDGSESPEHHVMDAERQSLLRQAVLSLPPALRIVLVLHDMEELGSDQIVQILNLQPGTVAVRLHRARLTLRREMSRILKGHPQPTASRSDLAHAPISRRQDRKRLERCRELFAALSDYLDGNGSPLTSEKIETHMRGCPNCVAFLNDLRASIDRCRSLQIPCDPAVTNRLRALFTQEYLRMLNGPVHNGARAMDNKR
jgi:RNA polymerase sigma-70 factor, ECF subfamily